MFKYSSKIMASNFIEFVQNIAKILMKGIVNNQHFKGLNILWVPDKRNILSRLVEPVNKSSFLLMMAILLLSGTVFAHSTQLGYVILQDGRLRVYTEHWHGPQSPNGEFANAPLELIMTYGNISINETVSASGYFNNVTLAQIMQQELNNGSSSYTITGECAADANNYNNWLYWDFLPAVCDQELEVTIIRGTQAITADACGTLFPYTFAATFADTAPAILTCEDVILFNCSTTVLNSIISIDDCDPNPTVTYEPATAEYGVTTVVTATVTDSNGFQSQCTFNVSVVTPDLDGDGFGDANATCGSQDDCDDNDPNTYPGAPELCDGKDNDCDGVVSTDEIDDDGDGYSECEGDCDDNNPNINADVIEDLTNGIDDNCDGLIDILPYCEPTGNYSCQAMYITNVTLGTINNSSGCEGGFSNYRNLSTELIPGNTYPISISGMSNPQYASVFIDWNIDGDFNDAGEEVANNIYVPYDGSPGSATFTVPSTASGSYTMRVITEYSYYYQSGYPCSLGGYGEAEDYTIVTFVDPIITCPTDISVSNEAGLCGANVTYLDTSVTDTTSTFTYSHASGSYFPVGTTTVTATATNDFGIDVCTFDVTVTNISPTNTEGIIAGIDPIQAGTGFNLSADFADDNLTSATWYFSSDGDFTNGDVAEYTSTGTIADGIVSGTFNFDASKTGVYAVKVVVEDACSEIAEAIYNYVAIYDASGGFVTGGGWFNSLSGALVGTNAVGKANFGLVAKYHTGNNNVTILDGNTNFQFKEGNFHFKSSIYDEMSLVISGEKKATYRGYGTVNGSGHHKFMVTVIDGDASGGDGIDKFRIKIWANNSNNSVIYDNELGVMENADSSTALGGGSIVIHKPKKGKGNENSRIEISNFLEVKIWPNPSDNNFNIDFKSNNFSDIVEVQVYDMLGKLVKVDNFNAKMTYNFGETLQSGIYFVKVFHANKYLNIRVIKN